jgi:methyl-accepting chemotaxis protein
MTPSQDSPQRTAPAGSTVPSEAIRPAVIRGRFMRRLSVGTKLWISTAILAAPLLGLGVFYVQSLTSTLWFTGKEQEGLMLFRPLDQFERRIAHHAELEGVALQPGASPSPEMQGIISEADADLAALAALQNRYGNAATRTQMKDLTDKWQALKSSKPESIQESLDAHDELIDAAFALRGQIAADWQLRLDPELAAYDLIDVGLMTMPDIVRYIGEARSRLADTNARKEFTSGDGFRIATLTALVGDRLVTTRDELTSAAQAAIGRPELLRLVNGIPKDWDTAADAWLGQVSKQLRSAHPDPAALQALLQSSESLSHSMTAVQDQSIEAANIALRERHDRQKTRATIALSSSALAMVLSLMLMFALVRRIAGAISRLLRITDNIAEGRYDNAIDESGSDEISRLYAGVAQMQRKLKSQIESDLAQLIATGRIRAALDNVSGNVMLADADGQIIYTNTAIDTLMRKAEADFRKELPGFSAASLRGASIDIFHKTPGQIRRMLSELRGTHSFQLRLGGRTFRMTANPVVTATGERIGTVVEWLDRTSEVEVESELQQMLTGVLAGDLQKRISLQGKTGFFETMSRGVNQLVENMLDIVSKVKQAADEVYLGAQEISRGNAELSERTEQQSSSLEETASSMEEMTATVKQNAANAGEASQIASAARDQAHSGGAVVGKAIAAMTEINQSSNKISDIIGVINDIAFQTNLLALNAAVEAARAGEQGRGFAVVATEVRNLAGRSAAAAKEIKTLIHDSVEKVKHGSVLVSESGQTLEKLVSSVKKVSDIMSEIAAASSEQSAGIEQVNRAVMQMGDMTQQNAALVEEAAAASKSMAEQASELNRLMERYRIDSQSSGHAAREARSVAREATAVA